MSRPNPIQYAERLYAAIRAANFSPISFLTFGNAVKDGVELRRMPRIAAEPFMRVVGEMLDLEEESAQREIIEAAVTATGVPESEIESASTPTAESDLDSDTRTTDGTAAAGDLTTSRPAR